MNLLLDTHVALWALADSPRLSDRARALIESPAATVWEGKLGSDHDFRP